MFGRIGGAVVCGAVGVWAAVGLSGSVVVPRSVDDVSVAAVSGLRTSKRRRFSIDPKIDLSTLGRAGVAVGGGVSVVVGAAAASAASPAFARASSSRFCAAAALVAALLDSAPGAAGASGFVASESAGGFGGSATSFPVLNLRRLGGVFASASLTTSRFRGVFGASGGIGVTAVSPVVRDRCRRVGVIAAVWGSPFVVSFRASGAGADRCDGVDTGFSDTATGSNAAMLKSKMCAKLNIFKMPSKLLIFFEGNSDVSHLMFTCRF